MVSGFFWVCNFRLQDMLEQYRVKIALNGSTQSMFLYNVLHHLSVAQLLLHLYTHA